MSKAPALPGPRGRPVRLGELARRGLKLNAWCGGCGRYRLLDPAPLLVRLGPSIAVSAIGRHLKCSACGGRRIEVRPHFPAPGVVASHRWRGR